YAIATAGGGLCHHAARAPGARPRLGGRGRGLPVSAGHPGALPGRGGVAAGGGIFAGHPKARRGSAGVGMGQRRAEGARGLGGREVTDGGMTKRQEIVDNLEQLLDVLPPDIRDVLIGMDNLSELLEIVLDLGRRPEARFPDGFVYLSEEPVTREDIDYVVRRVGEFGDDNRAGIERTLHRISAIRNRKGTIIGLTCRIGRAVFGTIDIIRDVIESGKSILLLGRPGVGKTTMLRETARVLADELNKRVIIVDTSNEIAGDGDVPHPAIG